MNGAPHSNSVVSVYSFMVTFACLVSLWQTVASGSLGVEGAPSESGSVSSAENVPPAAGAGSGPCWEKFSCGEPCKAFPSAALGCRPVRSAAFAPSIVRATMTAMAKTAKGRRSIARKKVQLSRKPGRSQVTCHQKKGWTPGDSTAEMQLTTRGSVASISGRLVGPRVVKRVGPALSTRDLRLCQRPAAPQRMLWSQSADRPGGSHSSRDSF